MVQSQDSETESDPDVRTTPVYHRRKPSKITTPKSHVIKHDNNINQSSSSGNISSDNEFPAPNMNGIIKSDSIPISRTEESKESSEGSSGSFLVDNPQFLAEEAMYSPHFTNPPDFDNNDNEVYIAGIESLLDPAATHDDDDDDRDDDNNSQSTLFEMEDDDIKLTNRNLLSMSNENEIRILRLKHAAAQQKLLAQQEQELQELAERQKQRRRAKNSDSAA